jgi:hypothetical protein
MGKTGLFAVSAAALILACIAAWAVSDTQARVASPTSDRALCGLFLSILSDLPPTGAPAARSGAFFYALDFTASGPSAPSSSPRVYPHLGTVKSFKLPVLAPYGPAEGLMRHLTAPPCGFLPRRGGAFFSVASRASLPPLHASPPARSVPPQPRHRAETGGQARWTILVGWMARRARHAGTTQPHACLPPTRPGIAHALIGTAMARLMRSALAASGARTPPQAPRTW